MGQDGGWNGVENHPGRGQILPLPSYCSPEAHGTDHTQITAPTGRHGDLSAQSLKLPAEQLPDTPPSCDQHRCTGQGHRKLLHGQKDRSFGSDSGVGGGEKFILEIVQNNCAGAFQAIPPRLQLATQKGNAGM